MAVGIEYLVYLLLGNIRNLMEAEKSTKICLCDYRTFIRFLNERQLIIEELKFTFRFYFLSFFLAARNIKAFVPNLL